MSRLSRRAVLSGLLSSAAVISAGPVAKVIAPEVAGGNQGLWLAEHGKFLSGMSQHVVSTIYYGNKDAVPMEFAGFAPAYDTSANVMDCGELPCASWATFFGESA